MGVLHYEALLPWNMKHAVGHSGNCNTPGFLGAYQVSILREKGSRGERRQQRLAQHHTTPRFNVTKANQV